MKNKYLFAVIIAGIAFTACKKNAVPNEEEPLSPTTGTRMEFTLDSIYLYAKQVYLWNDVLPSYTVFNPRKYTNISPEIDAYKTLLYNISQLKINPETTRPYEFVFNSANAKYAYLQKGSAIGKTAAVVSAGQAAVLKTATINANNEKIAYIALGSFPQLNTCSAMLDQAFAELAVNKPGKIIIDLRSNGGGYVKTAEYVANLVAASTMNGKVIYTEQYNLLLQSGKATILKNQPYLDESGKPVIYKGRNATMADVDFTESGNTYTFSKKGNMEGIKEIYFIVSTATASASEMLINSLKPYFNVKLAGVKTYGKPVGFFGIDVDVYGIYLPSFLIKNAEGRSDYFEGMEVDIPVKGDSNPVLGDPAEKCLSAVLAHISGTAVIDSGSIGKRKDVIEMSSTPVPLMIESRLKLKP